VCGAAAAIAVSSVVRTNDRQTAVAVATVVLFERSWVFLYPWMYELLTQHWHLAISEKSFGIFTGATLHEVAQVIAAGKMVRRRHGRCGCRHQDGPGAGIGAAAASHGALAEDQLVAGIQRLAKSAGLLKSVPWFASHSSLRWCEFR
jgi:hypothetical protein